VPKLPKKPCPKCGRLIELRQWICDKCEETKDKFKIHRPHWWKDRPAAQKEKRRGSSASRGYGGRWRRYRLRFLKAHPLCVYQRLGKPCMRPATVVDHIVPVKGPHDPNFWKTGNHQPLCHVCHNLKTSRDSKARLWRNDMKRFFAILVALAFPILALAADTSYLRYNASDNSWNSVKLIDNEDGTFSEGVAGSISIGVSGTFKQIASELYAPGSITYNGTATSWLFEVRGGSCSFTVAGSSSTTLVPLSGGVASMSGVFNPPAISPILDMTFLQAGATAQLVMAGGQ